MDAWGDHGLTCSCGGKRTQRHNGVRDVTYEDAVAARLSPERKKQGLLPSRPREDGLPVGVGQESRRPADVWLPGSSRFDNPRPEAIDFALTSGLRSDLLSTAIDSPQAVLVDYADFKKQYKQTDPLCAQQNLLFSPIIFEAHGGGWSTAALRLYEHIANRQSCSGCKHHEGNGLRIAQRISCAIHMANARAILRRTQSPPHVAEHATADLEAMDTSWQ